NLSSVFFNNATTLTGVDLGSEESVVRLADARLRDVNLSVIDWERIQKVGDEKRADRPYKEGKERVGGVQEVMRRKRKTLLERAEGYKEAERAYRALAVALSSQGLGSIATRYRYRAEVMERKAFFWRGPKAPWIYPRWAISWLLGTFAGYGNYLSRLFI